MFKKILLIMSFIFFSVSLQAKYVAYIKTFKENNCMGKELTRHELEELVRKGKNVEKACVGRITNFNHLFYNARRFNQDISNWNMQNAIDVRGMFKGAKAFNRPINKWNVENIKDFGSMLEGAESFDQDLSKWNVSKAEEFDNFSKNAKKMEKNKLPNFIKKAL